MMTKRFQIRPKFRTLGILAAVLFATGALNVATTTPSLAQDAAFGRGVWLSEANCADCHGWLGDGIPEDPRAPKGANLRETVLTEDQIIEVILCGRPGTGMPHFDARAYTDARCYNLTAAQIGDAVPPRADITLTRRHATGLALFILSEFAGKGAPTREDCQSLLGQDNPRCAALPPRA
jgi:mono/diheme cytochrome c family protein